MNTLQRLDVLQKLFVSLQNYTLGIIVGQRGKGDVPSGTLWRPCWSESGAGLGFSSHSAQTRRAQGDRQLAPHQDTLLDHPPVGTSSSCFITACPASQPQGSAKQHPGHGASQSSPPISPQLWGIPPPPSKIPQQSGRQGKQHGAG